MVFQFPVKLGAQPITAEQQRNLLELRRQLLAAGVNGQPDALRESLLRLGCETEREMTLALLRLVIDPPVVAERPYVAY